MINFRRLLRVLLFLVLISSPASNIQNSADAQSPIRYETDPPFLTDPDSHLQGPALDTTNGISTDYFTESNRTTPNQAVPVQSTPTQRTSGRPKGIPIGLESEWLTDSDVGLVANKASLKIPILFGRNNAEGPPPIVKLGFAHTDLFAANSVGLPDDLYEASVGLSWMYRFNDRWSVRTMLGVAYATDNENRSSDAWQFRGGAFAIYKSSEQWQWTFGAIALGRRDLPVIPAIGAVWQPSERTRFDFLLPKPKVNFLLADNGQRQHWVYLGGGLNGNTWAYAKKDTANDRLTYSDLRIVAGWQSKPTPPPGIPFAPGRKFGFEMGYAFSRDFEFADETIKAKLGDTLMVRATTSF